MRPWWWSINVGVATSSRFQVGSALLGWPLIIVMQEHLLKKVVSPSGLAFPQLTLLPPVGHSMDRRQVKEAHVAEAVLGKQLDVSLGGQQLVSDQGLKKLDARHHPCR